MLTWIGSVICAIFYVAVVLFAYYMGKTVGAREGEKRVLDQIALIEREQKKHRANLN